MSTKVAEPHMPGVGFSLKARETCCLTDGSPAPSHSRAFPECGKAKGSFVE